MADNTAAPVAVNGTAVNPGNATTSTAAPDNAAARSGGESANVDNPHGRYWRFCKKCRHARPTRWSYWEDKRNPPTSRHFWYFVSFAWRYLSASSCPECKCKPDDPPAPPSEETPIQSQRLELESLQEPE